MEAHLQIITAVEIQAPSRPAFKINVRPLRFGLYFLISAGIPLLMLLSYMEYAAAHGIILEKGCEGPGIPFSFLSGILFALHLRFLET